MYATESHLACEWIHDSINGGKMGSTLNCDGTSIFAMWLWSDFSPLFTSLIWVDVMPLSVISGSSVSVLSALHHAHDFAQLRYPLGSWNQHGLHFLTDSVSGQVINYYSLCLDVPPKTHDHWAFFRRWLNQECVIDWWCSAETKGPGTKCGWCWISPLIVLTTSKSKKSG